MPICLSSLESQGYTFERNQPTGTRLDLFRPTNLVLWPVKLFRVTSLHRLTSPRKGCFGPASKGLALTH